MVQHFLQSGRSGCSCRLTPFHPLSGKMTTRKKLVQLKNTSEEEQRNLVIYFLPPGMEAFRRICAFQIWTVLR